MKNETPESLTKLTEEQLIFYLSDVTIEIQNQRTVMDNLCSLRETIYVEMAQRRTGFRIGDVVLYGSGSKKAVKAIVMRYYELRGKGFYPELRLLNEDGTPGGIRLCRDGDMRNIKSI